jgi:hypothetical protein
MPRQQDLEKELDLWQRRLQKLKEQKARQGINTPPEVLNEIEEIEATIKKLQEDLAQLKQGAVAPAPPHKLDFNEDNVQFARFVSPRSKVNGNIGVLFYGFKIINSSKDNFTIKDVLFRYKLDGSEFSTISYVLLTSPVYSPLDKKNVETIAVAIRSGADHIMVQYWGKLD